jgi:hypothetical protein
MLSYENEQSKTASGFFLFYPTNLLFDDLGTYSVSFWLLTTLGSSDKTLLDLAFLKEGEDLSSCTTCLTPYMPIH